MTVCAADDAPIWTQPYQPVAGGAEAPLSRRLEELGDADAALAFSALCAEGLVELPPPGAGRTLERWRALAAVAAHDLSLAKLYEAHADALSILAELGQPGRLAWTWAVWAAEPPRARLNLNLGAGGNAVIDGRKAWCAGAGLVDHALATAWVGEEGPYLVAVDLRQPGVSLDRGGWQAVGMADTNSLDVLFDQVSAHVVGRPGDYLRRPGFWHGGAGIAACWYGATAQLGEALRRQMAGRGGVHALAHLGIVDVALAQAAAVLRETAAWIDAHPRDDARLPAMRVRAAVEAAARLVQDHVGRALGATPYCRDARFARLAADLPVFLRQSHAESDLEAIGQAVARHAAGNWTL